MEENTKAPLYYDYCLKHFKMNNILHNLKKLTINRSYLSLSASTPLNDTRSTLLFANEIADAGSSSPLPSRVPVEDENTEQPPSETETVPPSTIPVPEPTPTNVPRLPPAALATLQASRAAAKKRKRPADYRDEKLQIWMESEI